MYFDADETLKMALRLASAKTGSSISDLVRRALASAFQDDLRDAEKIIKGQGRIPEPLPPLKKRGRKPKSE